MGYRDAGRELDSLLRDPAVEEKADQAPPARRRCRAYWGTASHC